MSHTGDVPHDAGTPWLPPPGGVAGSSPSREPRPAPTGLVDVDALRHPTEGSRFALASIASTLVVGLALFVLVSLGKTSVIALVLISIAVFFFVLRLFLQLWRVRLLADGVRVTPETLPEVQDAVAEVRERLGFEGRVDVFVVDRVSRVLSVEGAPITLTSFFGVRVIVVEGGAIGDLSDSVERAQFIFMLATCYGALKARHTFWSPFLMALELTGLPKLVFLFVYPWYRATVYTGDRIAYACCGDLDVSLQAVYRALVGKEMAPRLRAVGLVDQALVVRRGTVLRLSQLLRSAPHATNRYLDLLSFAAVREPVTFGSFRAGLGTPPGDVDRVLARLGTRRALAGAAPAGIAVSLLLLVGGVGAGLAAQHSSLAQGIYDAFMQASGEPTDQSGATATETPSPTPTTVPSATTPTQASPAQALVARVPADLRESCTEASPDTGSGVLVALVCSPTGSSTPTTVAYYGYADTARMRTAFTTLAGNLAKGDCSTASPRQGTWSNLQVTRGPLACYTSQGGEETVLWGDDDAAVLAVAHDPALTSDELIAWWRGHAALTE